MGVRGLISLLTRGLAGYCLSPGTDEALGEEGGEWHSTGSCWGVDWNLEELHSRWRLGEGGSPRDGGQGHGV